MGETDFSFTFIYKCAKACGVGVVDKLPKTISGKVRRVEIRKNDLEKMQK